MQMSSEQIEQVIRQVTETVLKTVQGNNDQRSCFQNGNSWNAKPAQKIEDIEPKFRDIPRSVIVKKIRLHIANTRNVAFTPYEVADIIEAGRLGSNSKDVFALRSILDSISCEHKDVVVGKTKRTYYFFDNLCYEVKV